jgi:hypothetical protein
VASASSRGCRVTLGARQGVGGGPTAFWVIWPPANFFAFRQSQGRCCSRPNPEPRSKRAGRTKQGRRDTMGCVPASRLSENLGFRRSVSSGSSVWLSDGGGLTLFSPVDLIWV